MKNGLFPAGPGGFWYVSYSRKITYLPLRVDDFSRYIVLASQLKLGRCALSQQKAIFRHPRVSSEEISSAISYPLLPASQYCKSRIARTICISWQRCLALFLDRRCPRSPNMPARHFALHESDQIWHLWLQDRLHSSNKSLRVLCRITYIPSN